MAGFQTWIQNDRTSLPILPYNVSTICYCLCGALNIILCKSLLHRAQYTTKCARSHSRQSCSSCFCVCVWVWCVDLCQLSCNLNVCMRWRFCGFAKTLYRKCKCTYANFAVEHRWVCVDKPHIDGFLLIKYFVILYRIFRVRQIVEGRLSGNERRDRLINVSGNWYVMQRRNNNFSVLVWFGFVAQLFVERVKGIWSIWKLMEILCCSMNFIDFGWATIHCNLMDYPIEYSTCFRQWPILYPSIFSSCFYCFCELIVRRHLSKQYVIVRNGKNIQMKLRANRAKPSHTWFAFVAKCGSWLKQNNWYELEICFVHHRPQLWLSCTVFFSILIHTIVSLCGANVDD